MMERLVEEIGEMLGDYYVGEDAAGLSFLIPFHEDRKLAERIISRVLKAVVDGMPLPGEAGRYVWPTPGLKEEWIKSLYDKGFRVGGILIALSPEEE